MDCQNLGFGGEWFLLASAAWHSRKETKPPFLLDYDEWPLENKPKCPWNMLLMHTEGLVIYIQFKGVSDIRHDTQLVSISLKTEGTMCVNVCLRILMKTVN